MTRWIEDPSLDAPEGHHWVRPALDDCPNCPCHTARTCEAAGWALAHRPTHQDGTPYTEPCPCEQKGEEAGHEARTVVIELDGILNYVQAEFHLSGIAAGRMLTEAVFAGHSPIHGDAPGPLRMGLRRPTERDDPRHIVVDDRGERWVMGPTSMRATITYRITGFWGTGEAR